MGARELFVALGTGELDLQLLNKRIFASLAQFNVCVCVRARALV
jgi:hypothetical protein